jgi:hypothetical protein
MAPMVRSPTHSVACSIVVATAGIVTAACTSANTPGFGPDAAAPDGGSACTMAGTCIGAFFGACWDATGSCRDDAQTGNICFANGAKFLPAGPGLRGRASNRSDCFVVATSSDGNTYTFTDAQGTLVYLFQNGRLLVTCPDGSQINFGAETFPATDCATVLPPTSPALGTSRPCVAGICT